MAPLKPNVPAASAPEWKQFQGADPEFYSSQVDYSSVKLCQKSGVAQILAKRYYFKMKMCGIPFEGHFLDMTLEKALMKKRAVMATFNFKRHPL